MMLENRGEIDTFEISIFFNRSISKTIGSYELIFHKQSSLHINIHKNNVSEAFSEAFDVLSVTT